MTPAFAGGRVCDHCPAEAVVMSPGTQPVHELFLLVAGEPMRCWCLPCAQAAGWPWLVSEAPKRRNPRLRGGVAA